MLTLIFIGRSSGTPPVTPNPIALTTFGLQRPHTIYAIKTADTDFDLQRPRTTFKLEE